MRDHGGDLDRAQARFGAGEWLDLSTGINPVAYPLPPMAPRVWGALPTGADLAGIEAAARRCYGAGETTGCVALAGAQAAIQLVPRLARPGRARVLGPTYNEHAAALRLQGWEVDEVTAADALGGAELAVVVNPNNPDGRRLDAETLTGLAHEVGLLVVDESFADPEPGTSLVPRLGDAVRMLVLRSFGKFYGLAGVRLGFALGAEGLIAPLRDMAGPWAVGGPAIACGKAALADTEWRARTIARLQEDAARLDRLAGRAGWSLVGGTALFRTYDTGDARAAQERLARGHVWSRTFPYSAGWLRLGLPGSDAGWRQLEGALARG